MKIAARRLKEKLMMWIKSPKSMRFASFVVFIAIFLTIFLKTTYLFRNIDYNRDHIIGIGSCDKIDVAYVGGSAAYVYWQPPRAWNEQGITSYDFATDGLQAETIKGEIREILKTQNPKLVIIDARPFQYWDYGYTSETELGVRRVTDSMTYSMNRFLTVNDYFRYKPQSSIDKISYYLDIVKYHTNTSVLSSNVNWQMSNNKKKPALYGYEGMPFHEELSEPTTFITEGRAELGSKNILIDLMEFCSKNDLEVLFVVCPYHITMEEYKKYNTIKDIVKSYGYGFLNTNDFYSEMKLDFSKDVYNINHVNAYGAEKYTTFLAKYLVDNYNLIDHRQDKAYESWNETWNLFVQNDATIKHEIDAKIESKMQAYQDGLNLKNITDAYEWCMNVRNSNYIVFVEGQGSDWIANESSLQLLNLWNIKTENINNVIRVYRGSSAGFQSDESLGEPLVDHFDGHSDYNHIYQINSGEKGTIAINEVEYCKKQDGLNIVVYDNNYREVLDSVVIAQTDAGELVLVR